MLYDTPLRKRHLEYAAAPRTPAPEAAAGRPGAATGYRPAVPDVEYLAYGPAGDDGDLQCELPATFGSIETEYAALRRGAGVLDSPHRGTLIVRGGERRAFLGSMVTAPVADLAPGGVRPAFWLNRTGRIDADLLLAETGDAIVVDVDVFQAASAAASLGGFVFAEDVVITDETAALHHLAVHGPAACAVAAAAADDPDDAAAIAGLGDREAAAATIGGAALRVVRRDQIGAPGLEVIVPAAAAEAAWDALLGASADGGPVRPVGWFAYNMARIEAGTPLFNVDFGPTNLPHETGVLADRVSFTKGCYLGQEIVARMESRGKAKQVLAGLRVEGDRLPVAGGQVFAAGDEGPATPVGVVTSSTLSPMLGAVPIAFAMLRSDHAEPGTAVVVSAEGGQAPATVSGLRFWTAPA